MPPTRIEKDRKKRKINVILTPNPSKVLKKLRSDNCAVHVFVPGDEDLNELKDLQDTNSDSVTVVTRAGLKRLKELQSELQSPRSSPKTSSSSSSSVDSSSDSESENNMALGSLVCLSLVDRF